MNEPVRQATAGFLKIQGDPTWWGLQTAPPQDGWNDGPVAIDIISPVAGSLILSPARVGSYALTPGTFGPFNGWVWGGPIELVSPHLYIPTTTGLTAASHAYPLGAHYDLPALQQSILEAMTAGSTLPPVPVDVPGVRVILNGAQLPFAVLVKVQTA